jgi:PAS domain S-box-containing protein
VLQISKNGDLSTRVVVQGNDEFAQLAKGINAMLTTLEQSEQQLRKQTEISLRESEERNRVILAMATKDMAERKRFEHTFQEERNFISTILDTIGALVVVLDQEGHIVRFNRTAEDTTGYSFDEVKNRYVWDIFIRPDDMEQLTYTFNQIRAGHFPSKMINYWLTKNGEKRLIDWTNTALVNGKGKVEYIIATGIDISEQVEAEQIRSELEDQLRHAQKMESIGRLAGGVAHDFNNQLTAMMGYASLALRRIDEDNPARKDMEVILSSAEQASQLTRQLLAFARRQAIEPVVVNLNKLITDVNKMLSRLIGENIELAILLSESLGKIKADPNQLEQILLNLAINARDAMPNGGKLTIKTANVKLNHNVAYLDIKPGNYVRLTVSDTGIGMSDEVKSKIFEPFFTTKPVGQGTGLGLATCFGIIKQNEGHIRVESQPGEGTSFIIDLPCLETTDDIPEHMPYKETLTYLPKGEETVLLVEDELSVRQMIAGMLKKLGYTVLEAGNGEEALRLVREKTDVNIDLLMTDVIMPKMGGRELVEHIQANGTVILNVLFMSGYVGEITLQLETPHFLQKPFSLSKLAYKMRDVLGTSEKDSNSSSHY